MKLFEWTMICCCCIWIWIGALFFVNEERCQMQNEKMQAPKAKSKDRFHGAVLKILWRHLQVLVWVLLLLCAQARLRAVPGVTGGKYTSVSRFRFSGDESSRKKKVEQKAPSILPVVSSIEKSIQYNDERSRYPHSGNCLFEWRLGL